MDLRLKPWINANCIIVLTLSDEVSILLIHNEYTNRVRQVERIWKQKWSGATILFLINRYVTPLQFIIIIDGEFKRTTPTLFY